MTAASQFHPLCFLPMEFWESYTPTNAHCVLFMEFWVSLHCPMFSVSYLRSVSKSNRLNILFPTEFKVSQTCSVFFVWWGFGQFKMCSIFLTYWVLSESDVLNVSYLLSFDWATCPWYFLSMEFWVSHMLSTFLTNGVLSESHVLNISFPWNFEWVTCPQYFLPTEFWVSQMCSTFLTHGVLSALHALNISYQQSFEWVRCAQRFLPMEFWVSHMSSIFLTHRVLSESKVMNVSYLWNELDMLSVSYLWSGLDMLTVSYLWSFPFCRVYTSAPGWHGLSLPSRGRSPDSGHTTWSVQRVTTTTVDTQPGQCNWITIWHSLTQYGGLLLQYICRIQKQQGIYSLYSADVIRFLPRCFLLMFNNHSAVIRLFNNHSDVIHLFNNHADVIHLFSTHSLQWLSNCHILPWIIRVHFCNHFSGSNN